MKTAGEYIKLVGRRDIRRRLGVSQESITHAKRRGVFPASWYRGLVDLAVEKGVDLPPFALFAMKEPAE